MSAALRRVEIERTRSARMVLEPNGLHHLYVDLGYVSQVFARADAQALSEALITTPPDTALVLLKAFAPGVRSKDDVSALLRALLAFDEEVVAEDNRSSERMHKAAKPVPL